MGESGQSDHPHVCLPPPSSGLAHGAPPALPAGKRDVFIRKTILEAAKLCANRTDCSTNERVTQESAVNEQAGVTMTQKAMKNYGFHIRKKKVYFPSQTANGCFFPFKWTKEYLEEEGDMKPFLTPQREMLGEFRARE